MVMRKRLVRRIRKRTHAIWPIFPGSERPPQNWRGWPHGKKFAFILTHDVEGQQGLDRVKQLAELEMELGFRSSFNLIPEGPYRVPLELRRWLIDRGFEVGIHDLHHDGKLYSSREAFLRKASRINEYARDWHAVGFRSGFMLHNLDWLPALDIEYDLSCFDTDPFEPQPDGAHTIFPFWVPGRSSQEPGFVEMPYTLCQDSTVFLLLGEEDDTIWRRKLDWVAGHGGMALLNLHPDYVAFDHKPKKAREFSASLYSGFLRYVYQNYQDSFWNALPREAAKHAKDALKDCHTEVGRENGRPISPVPSAKVWIDLDNTPHVPFFIPIIRELKRRGHRVVVTARDAFQVCDLADRKGLVCTKIGRHYGKNVFLKILGLVWRSCQLLPFYAREKPDIALSHGSRSQLLLSNMFRKATILISDWEFSKAPPLTKPRWEIVPELYPNDNLLAKNHRVRRYVGIKEDVYATEFKPDSTLLHELKLHPEHIIITVRPPASEAHYHNTESELLLNELMKRICRSPEVQAVLLPRNGAQEKTLRDNHPEWFSDNKTIVPTMVVDGLNLLWHSDLVVSGGGTMNREAAALGVPVYSIFRGKTGAIDLRLEQEGRLVLIRTPAEVQTKIDFKRRPKSISTNGARRMALENIVNHVEDIVRAELAGHKALAISQNGPG